MPNDVLSDDLDPVIQAELEGKRARFKATVSSAVTVNPDEQAKYNRIASFLDQPKGVVAAMPADAERSAAIKTVADNAAISPVLQKKYSDADFANLAHDDSGVLSSMAAAAKWLVSAPDSSSSLMGDIAGGYHGASSGVSGAFGAVARTVGAPLDWLDNTSMPGGNPLRRLSEGFMSIANSEADAQKAAQGTSQSWLGGAVSSGVQSLSQNILMLPMALLPGGQAATLTGMASMAGGQSYQKDMADGVPHWKSLIHGASDAAIEAGTEMMPLGNLVHEVKAGTPLFTTILKNAWAENKGEQIATALQDLNDWAINDVNKGKTFGDYLAARPEAAAQTLVAVLVGAGGNVSLMHGVQGAVDRASGFDRQAQVAEEHAQVLEAMQTTMAASKLLVRSPDTLRSYAQDLVDEGVPTVFVDSAKLAEAGVDLQALAESMPSVAAQLDQVQTGGDFAIPTGEMLANSIGTEFSQALIDHARTDVNGMSRAEAKVYMQEKGDTINAEIARVMDEKANDAEFKTGRDQVQAQILNQLNEVKRFTPVVNDHYATLAANFYAVMAARTGMTVQDFANRYQLGFSGQNQAGGMYDQAREQGYDGQDHGEATEWLNAKAKGLDMSQPARQQRAVDLGFLTTDKWQGVHDAIQRNRVDSEAQPGQDGRGNSQSGDGDTGRLHAPGQLARFFHGTKDDVASFDPNHPNRKDAGWLGRGTYVTSNPDHAELYSEQKRGEGSPRIMPLAIRLENPFVADALFKQKMSRLSPAGVAAMTERLKAAGYDGVVLGVDSETTEVVVFDPAAVRSENAAFDPEHKDGTNLLDQQAVSTESKEFKAWFGESKVVDTEGKPMVVYHGTQSNFDSVDTSNTQRLPGFWVTPDAGLASSYAAYGVKNASTYREGANVMPLYAKIEKPYYFDPKKEGFNKAWDAYQSGDFDGFIEHGNDASGVTTINVKDGSQIKSATGNNGNFDGTNPNILYQSATLRNGEETLAKYGLPLGGKYNTRDIAAALEARQREKYGKIDPTDRSDEAAGKIAEWMAEEVRFEMLHPRKSGVGWYSYKFQRALDIFGEEFPELKKDKDARATLTALIAITSDGQKVVPNFRMAVDLYRNFSKTGKFTTERGHSRMESIQGNIDLLQTMLDDMGPKAMRKYLLQEATVSELRQRAKAEGVEFKTDYQAHIKVPMAAVTFGPKLGAFYANLMGAHGYLTMDRWWSRTFNRYRGTLLQAPTKDGLKRIKELMGHPEWSDDQAISATVEPRNSYEAKNFKNGTEIEKAANTVYKAAFENLEDAPFNATDRTFMLQAVDKAQQILAAEGRKISVADIQAVLWYYEKRLYGELGARQTADVSYEDAAKKVVGEQADAGGAGRSDARGPAEGTGENDAGAEAGVSEETVPPGLEPFDGSGVGGTTTLYQGDPADLVAQHNLTAANLLHAVKMGGIPVPSLAVTNKAHPLTGFGEITLVAPSAMVDPQGYAASKVFGADIYSPRYPQITYELTPAKLKSLKAQFAEGEKATGATIQLDELGKRGADEMTNSAAVMWQFLTEQGVVPDIKTKEGMSPQRLQRLKDFGFEKFFGDTDHQSLMRNDEFQKLVIAEQNDENTSRGWDDLVIDYEDTKVNDWSRLMALSRNPAYEMVKVGKEAEPDGYATRDALRAQIRGTFDDAFKGYVNAKFEALGAKEKIFQGFTDSGNRKYTPHTLENVVKILKKELRGGEGFNYGVGSLRAKFTPQFKSIEQIRKAKGRLMDKASFEAVKDEVDNELNGISDALGLSLDQTIEVLEDAPKMGVTRAVERAFKDYKRGEGEASDATKERIAQYLTRLKNLPTEYFEAKILRDVDLAEFKGAVVPEGVDPKVIEALTSRGVTDIRTYKPGDEADRAAKIGEFGHLFFQDARGQISFANDITQQASVISLLKNADLSTFIHESGHFFLEVQADLASRISARIAQGEQVSDDERSILDDFNTTMKWMGVTGDENLTPVDQWAMMSADEKRQHHEKFARGFEAYAFDGQAPSLELQRVFQSFRAWLVNVYRALLKSVNASRSDVAGAMKVQLSDEVRSVMDRMLATTDAIQEAEAARSMGPLFMSAESEGMDMDAYKIYHDLGLQATQAAIQERQARGLRDMQWLQNARSRKLKELQKQHDGLRAQIAREVRGDVMSQPIYRAWTFLTAKAGDKVEGRAPVGNSKGVNPEVDNLFTAIAKLGGLDRDQVKKLWGIDAKEKLDSGVFGSPVVRKTGGLSMDAMAERLMEEGYLLPDEHGKADEAKFEALFDDQRRGTDRYSIKRDMAAAYGEAPLDVPELPDMGHGKLRTQDLRDSYGEADDAVWRKLSELRMTSDKGGLHPDVVGELFGFGSGDELVKSLAAAEPPKSVIEDRTDQRMLEEHGDLATPAGLERAADAAIHNDYRVRFVAAELRVLQHLISVRDKQPGTKSTVDVIAKAAKDYSERLVARLKLKDIRPSQYAAAAARSGRLAEKNRSDLEEAAKHKRNQVINIAAAKAAFSATDEVEKINNFFRKVVGGKDANIAKSRDMDIVNAARAVLGNFGFGAKAKTAAEYLESVKAYNPGMYEVLRQSTDAATAMAKPFKELTLEELRGLHAEVESLWHLSSRSKQMEIDGNMLDRADVAKLLVARMEEIGIPTEEIGSHSAVTEKERRAMDLSSVWATMTRVESFVDLKDGFNKMGAFRRNLWTPIKEAADQYRAAKLTYLRSFRVAFSEITGTMKRESLYSPELDYTFGKDSGGVALNEILHAILHTGNESNMKKMLVGRGWASINEVGQVDTRRWDAFINRLAKEGKLTKAHFDFAQKVWDLLESTKPMAQKAHRDAYGKYFEEITANPVHTPFGVYPGGYAPAMVDSRVVKDMELKKLIEEGKDSMVYAFPATSKGFTKGRVEYNKPLLLDLRTLPQHIDKVLLFSFLENPVRDAAKLMGMSEVSTPLNKQSPSFLNGVLTPWLTRVARQQVTTPVVGAGALMRTLNTLRNRTSMATMFANLSNTVQQVSGFVLAGLKVKPSSMASATALYMKSPKKMVANVAGLSVFMANRMSNEVESMMGEIEAILLDPTLYESAQAWTKRHTFFMQSAVDNVMGPIIWTGAFNDAVADGFSDEDAVRIADASIRQTQGSTLPEDVSRIETGPAYARILTQFYGYFNMQANLVGAELGKVSQEMGLRKGMGKGLYIFLLGVYAPALVAELIAQMFRGGPGDDDKDGSYLDDWLMALFVTGPIRNVTAFIPFAGAAANSAIARFNSNPADDKMSMSASVGAVEASVGVPYDLYKAAVGEGNAQRTVRDVATLLSITVGLPASVAARPVGYLAGVLQEKIDPTGPVDAMRGFVTGAASPDSKSR